MHNLQLLPPLCVACDAPGARPSEGHTSPLCLDCETAWLASPERARAVSARTEFVERRRKEISGG
jgi:hypothetical protein